MIPTGLGSRVNFFISFGGINPQPLKDILNYVFSILTDQHNPLEVIIMTDDEFMKFMEEEGVDESTRRVIVEAWRKVLNQLWEESRKELN